MYMNSDLLGRLAQERQRQLLHEAEVERQVMQACVGRPSLSLRIRQQLSALLVALGRSVQPRRAVHSRKARLTQSPG